MTLVVVDPVAYLSSRYGNVGAVWLIGQPQAESGCGYASRYASVVGWLRRPTDPARRRSPIPVLTGLDVG